MRRFLTDPHVIGVWEVFRILHIYTYRNMWRNELFHIVNWFSPLHKAENIKQRWTNLARGSFQGESNMKIFSNYFWRRLFDWFISDNILYRPSSSRVQSLHKSDTVSTWLTKPPTYFHYTSINVYKIPYVLASAQVSPGFPVALN